MNKWENWSISVFANERLPVITNFWMAEADLNNIWHLRLLDQYHPVNEYSTKNIPDILCAEVDICTVLKWDQNGLWCGQVSSSLLIASDTWATLFSTFMPVRSLFITYLITLNPITIYFCSRWSYVNYILVDWYNQLIVSVSWHTDSEWLVGRL